MTPRGWIPSTRLRN